MSGGCAHCEEAKLNIGDKSGYGATILCKMGCTNDGWFATLSPKTGGDPHKDFTIQIMPIIHITHISELCKSLELAKNYGLIFSRVSRAVNFLMKEENRESENEEKVIRIGTYGKSKHQDEHLHIKVFPWTGNIGQPYTVDSSFEKCSVYSDEKGENFVKMKPVRKTTLPILRMDYLSNRLIELLK